MRVLLVEDDNTIGEAVQTHLTDHAYAVDWASDLAHARDFVAVARYDMLLVDLGLPDGNGMELIRDIRRSGSDAAVLILSAQDQISKRISALNEGADDYLTKPFDLSELLARIAAVARRYAGQPQTQQTFGALTIDTTNRRALRDNVVVDLSSREWAVLMRLLLRPNAIVAKSEIEDALYAFGTEVESNTVEVYVSRLRKKLGRDAIRTLRGVGYTVPRGEE